MIIARTKTAGIFLCLLGAILMIGAQYAGFQSVLWINGLALGLLAAGGIAFIGGLFHSVIFQIRRETSLHAQDGTVAAMALIRCMVAVSIADGHLDDREVNTIARIYRHLMKSPMEPETIRETARHMIQEGTDLRAEIHHVRNSLYKDLRRKILKACLHILAADGQIDAREEEMLELIRKGFRLPRKDLRRMKRKFLDSRPGI
ncbi:MAG: TerB family tellurite resistance protein [Alphaproteobacteria bacterium]|nr:TerB family tellurite resistance protein [Alphaproteobacteria bacterium]